jgi:hypothetical protein
MPVLEPLSLPPLESTVLAVVLPPLVLELDTHVPASHTSPAWHISISHGHDSVPGVHSPSSADEALVVEAADVLPSSSPPHAAARTHHIARMKRFIAADYSGFG